MFCTKCGTQIADDAKFCPGCGASTAEEAPAPVYSLPPQTPKLPKGKYFFTKAAASMKILNIVSFVLGILCLLTLILPVVKFLSGPFYEIPILKLMDGTDGVELEEIMEEYEEVLEDFENADDDDELEYIFEREFDISVDELEDDFDISLEEFIDLLDPLSITNLVKLMAILEADDEVLVIFRIITTAMYVICAVLSIVTALGVGFQKTWVMVVAYIFSFGFIAFTGGFLFWLLATLAYVGCAVLFSLLKKNYKAYLADPAA